METLEESTAIVIVEAAAEVRKRERDIADTRNTAQVMHISCNQLMAQSWRRSFAPPLLSHEFHTFVIERHCWKIPSVVAGKMNNGPTMN